MDIPVGHEPQCGEGEKLISGSDKWDRAVGTTGCIGMSLQKMTKKELECASDNDVISWREAVM